VHEASIHGHVQDAPAVGEQEALAQPRTDAPLGDETVGADKAELNVKDTRRTPEKIIEEYSKCSRDSKKGHTPRDSEAFSRLPRGPWNTIEKAQAALSSYGASNGYEFYRSSHKKASATRGARYHLLCLFNASTQSEGTGKRTKAPRFTITSDNRCSFYACMEKSTEGWIIVYGHLDHSQHPGVEAKGERQMATATGETLLYTKSQYIPDVLIDGIDPDGGVRRRGSRDPGRDRGRVP